MIKKDQFPKEMGMKYLSIVISVFGLMVIMLTVSMSLVRIAKTLKEIRNILNRMAMKQK